MYKCVFYLQTLCVFHMWYNKITLGPPPNFTILRGINSQKRKSNVSLHHIKAGPICPAACISIFIFSPLSAGVRCQFTTANLPSVQTHASQSAHKLPPRGANLAESILINFQLPSKLFTKQHLTHKFERTGSQHMYLPSSSRRARMYTYITRVRVRPATPCIIPTMKCARRISIRNAASVFSLGLFGGAASAVRRRQRSIRQASHLRSRAIACIISASFVLR
jgi:hypothetical protein